LWLHSLKVAQLLRSAACLHTNQSRSYLNHLVFTQVAHFCYRLSRLHDHIAAVVASNKRCLNCFLFASGLKKVGIWVRMILSQCCALPLCVWQACLASATSHPRSSVGLHLSQWLCTRKDIMYLIHCIVLSCMFTDILLFYPILYAAAYQKVSPSKFPHTCLISPIQITWPVYRTPPDIHYRNSVRRLV